MTILPIHIRVHAFANVFPNLQTNIRFVSIDLFQNIYGKTKTKTKTNKHLTKKSDEFDSRRNRENALTISEHAIVHRATSSNTKKRKN